MKAVTVAKAAKTFFLSSFKTLLCSTIFTLGSVLLINWICMHCNRCARPQSRTATQNDSLEIDRVWEDADAIATALNRTGLGEGALPAYLEDEQKRLYMEFGYDAILSDQIALNRSLPDLRHPDCRNITYLAELPLVSVVVIFHNEQLSVLLRTVHSILNRSPPELLNEIILVNDCSTLESLGAPLEEYLALHLPQPKVRLVRTQPHRMGLMVARMTGARAASKQSGVLVFLDSHVEVMYNWLPPLVEPIALNSRAVTCPIIDTVYFKTFEYIRSGGYLGFWDWTLWLRTQPLTDAENHFPSRPYHNFVMLGGAMAIGAEFFWQLGGYDEGMQYWGAEQFEISFKVWMCGGELFDIPCSRMGHLYRDPDTKGNSNLYGDFNFVSRNQRRLIEVWMDPLHRDFILNRSAALRNADTGDLSERHAIRKRLNCKSFAWLMANPFSRVSEKFPMFEPADFANGVIESLGAAGLCIDNMGGGRKMALYECSLNKSHPQLNQFYRFTWRRDIKDTHQECLEPNHATGLIREWGCHVAGGNQNWYYDRWNKWIVHDGHNCMEANETDHQVHVNKCDKENHFMRWKFGFVNETRMQELETSENKEKESKELYINYNN